MQLQQSIKDRFPTRQAIWLVLIICALPIHIWSWLIFFYKLPSFLLRLHLLQILSVFAYLQLFALLETLLLCLLNVGIAFLLPAKYWRDRFIAQSTVLVASLTLWAVVVQNQARAIENQAEIGSTAWVTWWTVGCLLVLISFSLVIARWPKTEKVVLAFADRSTVLASFFLTIDLFSLIVVLSRNFLAPLL